MLLALLFFAAISLAELLLWLPGNWRMRTPLATLLAFALSVSTAHLVITDIEIWTIIVLFLSVYRIINLLRLSKGQLGKEYVVHVARTTSIWLIVFQVITISLAGVDSIYQFPTLVLWYNLSLFQLAFAAIVFLSTARHLRTTKPPLAAPSRADRDLPSVTVAIPARNETLDLEACLQSLITTTYPKLEILVLDDCSQNKRTPEIIRDFAHAGVRFLAGKEVPDNWLAKNYAYAQLADEASGEIILFCGVDTRFQPHTLQLLVEALLYKQKSMSSVLPRNSEPAKWSLEQLMVQPSRYAWELALPRRWLNRPPVLSTCWLITSEALHAAGGFAAVCRSGSPESYFARATAEQDGYTFICSDARIGLSCNKSLPEQRATAIRTRYLQLHRRPEIAALLTLSQITILVGPYITLIAAILSGHWQLGLISASTCVLLTIHYAMIVSLTYRHFLLRGLWLLPFAAVYDSCLLNYSMWQYEFNEVLWKGRNVCLPLMRLRPPTPG